MTTRLCEISACGTYRYWLEEALDSGFGSIAWLMLNPSTADATVDDPTIRKVRGFSRRAGFRRWIVVNLFAFRATDPKACAAAIRRDREHAIGPENNEYILDAHFAADRIVCAWGAHSFARGRAGWVVHELLGRELVPESKRPFFVCLGKSPKTDAPFHPLMQPYETDGPRPRLELFSGVT